LLAFLGAHHILYISRLRVNAPIEICFFHDHGSCDTVHTHCTLQPCKRNLMNCIGMFSITTSAIFGCFSSYLIIIIIGIQPLGRSGQRPELSQSTGIALARCILGKFLGVVCHCLPLLPDVNHELCRKKASLRTLLFASTQHVTQKLPTLQYIILLLGAVGIGYLLQDF